VRFGARELDGCDRYRHLEQRQAGLKRRQMLPAMSVATAAA
jgi:hypothetical protein